MNKLIEYNSNEYRLYSKLLGSDIWYYLFTRNNGFKLRLNKKSLHEEYVVKFLGFYNGIHSKKHDKCLYYKSLFDGYIIKHQT